MRIEIIQSGRVLRQHNYEGRSYIEAPPEGEYTIRLTNTLQRARTPNGQTGRQLAVVSVDGLNIITGEKAGFSDPGYVVLAGQTIEIPGWRRTDSEVAAFQFKPQEGSYTAAMGNGTSNTGVIGLAVFNEKAKPELWAPRSRTVTTTTTTTTETMNDRINRRARSKGVGPAGHPISANSAGTFQEESSDMLNEGFTRTLIGDFGYDDDATMDSMPVAAATAAASADDTDYGGARLSMDAMDLGRERSAFRSVRRRRETPELGTGYGGRQTMYTTETTFERATEVPYLVMTLQYAVRAKLVEWGVPLPELPPTPSAFPAASHSVQSPPGWRG